MLFFHVDGFNFIMNYNRYIFYALNCVDSCEISLFSVTPFFCISLLEFFLQDAEYGPLSFKLRGKTLWLLDLDRVSLIS